VRLMLGPSMCVFDAWSVYVCILCLLCYVCYVMLCLCMHVCVCMCAFACLYEVNVCIYF